MQVLLEITPLDPVVVHQGISIGGNRITLGGNVVTLPRPWLLSRPTLRLSSAQHRDVTGLNGVRWWPGIIRRPTLGMQLFDGDFSGSVRSGNASMDLSMAALAEMDPLVRRYVWAGAAVTIYVGEIGQVWPWTKKFVGRVSTFRIEADKLSITAEVDEEPFNANLLSASYAGTGGLEGGSDVKGKPKPWAFGNLLNIEPVLIDSISSVYQVSAYGPIKSVAALYERGWQFSAPFGDYVDYAALVAANIPPGRWGTCLAQGLIRLGAPQAGVITADVQGDYSGSVWRRLPGAILQRICAALGVSGSLINTTSLDAFDTALSALPDGGYINLYLTEQESVLDLARRIALPCNYHAGVSWLGQLFITKPQIGSPSVTMDPRQRREPRVVASAELDVSPPYARIQMGGQQSWRVHTFDEIATGYTLIERGLYAAGTVYREGNIVSLDDGSRWLYVGTTPLSGSAPSDANTNWSRMTNAVQEAAIAAAASAASAAQADAATALATLTNIASDSLLTPDEKPRVILDRDAIVAEQSGIDAQATAFAITTEKTDYDNAVSALTTYLATLTAPVLWSNLTGNTTIVGATFRTRFGDVYAARQALLNKIADEAAKRSTWSGVSGTGKPADNATVGAPTGTNVGSTPAATVEIGANAANAGVNSDGTIKDNKVDTPAVVPDAIVAPIAGITSTGSFDHTSWTTRGSFSYTPYSANSNLLALIAGVIIIGDASPTGTYAEVRLVKNGVPIFGPVLVSRLKNVEQMFCFPINLAGWAGAQTIELQYLASASHGSGDPHYVQQSTIRILEGKNA